MPLDYFLQADTPLKASRRTGVMGMEGGISTLHMKFNKRVEIEFWGISSRNGVFWEGGDTLPQIIIKIPVPSEASLSRRTLYKLRYKPTDTEEDIQRFYRKYKILCQHDNMRH